MKNQENIMKKNSASFMFSTLLFFNCFPFTIHILYGRVCIVGSQCHISSSACVVYFKAKPAGGIKEARKEPTCLNFL